MDVFWTFINRDSRLLYGTFSGVVKSDLWQSNNVLCVFVCADRVGYDHQQQNQFAECEYGQLSVFCLFSCNRGVTLSAIFLMYTQESIATTFGITAGTFGATALFGYVTKKDLSKMGSILFMLLIGLIIASVVNMFLKNDTMMWILTYVGIVIFVGLTAYDMQKLKKIAHSIDDDESSIAKFAVLGALTLYLDFINLFLRLLQIFGKKR